MGLLSASILGRRRGVARFLVAGASLLVSLTAIAAKFEDVKSPVVNVGDHYFYYDQRIDLERHTDKIAVKLDTRAKRAAVERLAATLASVGAKLERDMATGVVVFSLESAGDSTVAVDAVRQALAGDASVEWVAPVFRPVKTGNLWVATNEVMVRTRTEVEGVDDLMKSGQFSKSMLLPGTRDTYILTLSTGAGDTALAVANELSRSGRYLWAEPNAVQVWQKYSVNDPLYPRQWHLHNPGGSVGGNPGQTAVADADVDAPEAWAINPGGSPSIVVAVLDDGPEDAHADLAPNLFNNPNEIPGDGVDNDLNGYIDDVKGWDFSAGLPGDADPGPSTVDDEHGTSVAGVIAARGNNSIGVAGIAYNARWFASRIFLGASAASANIGAAINYAVGRNTNPASTWTGAAITNNSWGGGSPSAAITDGFTWGGTNGRGGRGVASFIASGNGGGGTPSYPASLAATVAGVVCVGASNDQDLRSSYSQFGTGLDFMAPSNGGTYSIVTTDRTGALGYDPNSDYTGVTSTGTGFGGTSSATPLAAGIGALVLSQAPTLTVSELRVILRATTDPIGPAGTVYTGTAAAIPGTNGIPAMSGWNNLYGFGRLNAAKALSAIGVTEINVFSGSTPLPVGSALGLSALNGTSATRTVTIRNEGQLPLTIGSLALTAGPITLGSPTFTNPSLTIGQTETITLNFNPTSAGTGSQTLTFTSNDANEGAYSITLIWTSTPVSAGGRIVEDLNGNVAFDATDAPLAGRLIHLDANHDGIVNSTGFVASTNVPLAIPDANAAGVNSTLTLSGAGSLVAIRVRFSITHTWAGDVRLRLRSPAGTTIELFAGVGGSGDNFTNTILDDTAPTLISAGTAPFTGTFRPLNPLAGFAGQNANGTWTLNVADLEAPDTGSLTAWAIEVVQEPSQLSAADGSFAFAGVADGTYTLRAALPAGWTRLAPASGTHTVTIAGGNENLGRHFVDVRQNTVYGRVFNDANRNGLMDAGEAGLAGRTVYRDGNNNAVFDSTLTTLTSTDVPKTIPPTAPPIQVLSNLPSSAAGSLSDVDVVVNSITHTFNADLDVFLRHPDGTRVELFTDIGGSGDNIGNTTVAPPLPLILDQEAATSIATITAATNNINGRFRPEGNLATLYGKPAAGNWVLEVNDDANLDGGSLNGWGLVLSISEAAVTTDANGFFVMTGVPAGISHLRVLPPAGWPQTHPAFNAPQTISLTAGGTMSGMNFGLSNSIRVTVTPLVADRTSANPIPFRVVFSEAVTGFDAGDLAITNGTVHSITGSGTTYTVNVTPTAVGRVRLSVVAGAVTGGSSNTNVASAPAVVAWIVGVPLRSAAGGIAPGQ